MTKNTLGNVPNWDLSDFYSSIKDKKIASDLENCAKNAKSFAKKYQGKVEKLSAPDLFKAIKKYEEISEKMAEISSYSYLIYAIDLSNQKNIAFHQDISEKLTDPSSNLIFFSLEINEIDDEFTIPLTKAEVKEIMGYVEIIEQYNDDGEIIEGVSTQIPEHVQKEFQVVRLIDGYRMRGHLFTKTNPVRDRRTYSQKTTTIMDICGPRLTRRWSSGHRYLAGEPCIFTTMERICSGHRCRSNSPGCRPGRRIRDAQ